MKIHELINKTALSCLLMAGILTFGCSNTDVRGTYQSVSESEWNLSVELNDDSIALIILESWLPGEFESRQVDTTTGRWSTHDGVVLLSYDNVVDTLIYDERLSLKELDINGGAPGLVHRTRFDRRTLIGDTKLWKMPHEFH